MAQVRVTWHGEEVKKRQREGRNQGLWLAALHLLGAANEHVPIEEATLERSGVASVDKSRGVSAVSYNTPYAVIQHESLEFRHDPGRTAKWLEVAMETERKIILAIIAAQIRKSMGT